MLRTLSERTTDKVSLSSKSWMLTFSIRHTFIFANILESKGQAGILALDDSNLTEGSFADHSQKPKMVEID